MKWKEVYEKCNNKKYSAILNIKQPVTLKSTFSIFLDKYKLPILICAILLSATVLISSKLNLEVFLCFIAIMVMLTITLIYYNTYKIELKNNDLNLNIMFREIKIKQDDLANIYIEKRTSNLLMIIPFNYYLITIIYSDNGTIRGYSLSTVMTRKTDVLKFFKHFEFKKLKQQEEEDKKDNIYNGIRRVITIFIAIVIVVGIVLYLV